MGARTLKKWLERPLMDRRLINERLQIVDDLYSAFMERDMLREALKSVYDLERLAGRISFGNVNARDLIQLKQSLHSIPQINEILRGFSSPEVTAINEKMAYSDVLLELFEQIIF